MPPAANASQIRQAILLVGGRGTRMWPLTADRPKGLLPVAGVPFVEYQLRQLGGVGISEVFLAVGLDHLAAWEAFAAGSPAGMKVRLAVEDEPLDTAGPVRAVLSELDERFMVLNGDVIIEADLRPLVTATAPATLGLVEVDDTSAYGVVVLDDAGKVEQFVEKPPSATAPARTVNAGMYSLSRAVLTPHPLARLSFERVVFPELSATGSLHGVVLDGRWLDIGTPELYLAAHDAVFAGESRLHRPEQSQVAPEGSLAEGVMRPGAWSWIGEGAVVAAGATISEAVVMAGATIGAEAVVRRAVVGPGARIGAGAMVTGASLVGAGAEVGERCEIDHGMRVAPGALLGPGSVTFLPPK